MHFGHSHLDNGIIFGLIAIYLLQRNNFFCHGVVLLDNFSHICLKESYLNASPKNHVVWNTYHYRQEVFNKVLVREVGFPKKYMNNSCLVHTIFYLAFLELINSLEENFPEKKK